MNQIASIVGHVAFVATAMFLILLAVLHVLKPEFDPSWRLISEYAIGDYGWMMTLAFFCLAVACVALVLTTWPFAPTIASRIGLLFFVIVAIGLSIAAIFTCDPITAITRTPSDRAHAFGALLVIPVFPIAATLVSWSLFHRPEWASSRSWLPWVAVLVWVGFLGFVGWIILVVGQRGGRFEGTLIGLPNRAMIVTYAIWLMSVAHYAARLPTRSDR
jgi:Protein of unknown function (DUF998)